MQFIDLKKQYRRIETKTKEGINRVLEHGQYIMGPEVSELEATLASFVGVKHAVACSSGTDALLLSLLALGIKAGDEVITTPFSFFATAEVIALIGAKPVFVDIEPETYNIDSHKIESAITEKTRAIMPVSLYGQCADMDHINDIAKKHGLSVIEDGAQSFGATYKGRQSCGLSTIGCTSFFPSKPLGGYGDSGACFTDDDAIATKLRQLVTHGQSQRYKHASLGINGRMDSIQAAILQAKMEIFPEEVSLRQDVANRYETLLAGLVHTPILRSSYTSVFAQYTIEVSNRDKVQEKMKGANIPTAVHYPIPMHRQEALAYLNYNEGDFPVAELAATKVMSLPMHPYLEMAEQKDVVKALQLALEVAD